LRVATPQVLRREVQAATEHPEQELVLGDGGATAPWGGSSIRLVDLPQQGVWVFNHKAQLVVILDWLEWLGLIRREREMVHAGQVLPAPPA
jgi:hypothetical protein